MLTYTLRRLLLVLPTLLGISLVVFLVMALSPGGLTAESLVPIGGDIKQEQRKAIIAYYNQRYGLDQPLPIQYLTWLNNVSPIGFERDAQGGWGAFSFIKGIDWGNSLHYGRSVSDILSERIPITLLLNILTLPFIYALAIYIGMRAALRRGQRFDVNSNLVLLGLWSAPSMLVGVLLLGFLANSQYLQWFPTAGLSSATADLMPMMPHTSHASDVWLLFFAVVLGLVFGSWLSRIRAWGPKRTFFSIATSATLTLALATTGMSGTWVQGFLLDRIWHLILPIICLSYGGLAALAKLTRTSILENLSADFARTAKAKGCSEERVLWGHVMRNSLLPLITVSAGLLPSLLAGSLIVENIFSINGMGQLVVEAVKNRDRELVLAISAISGFLTLAGYLIADLLYAWVDPRVSYA